LRRRVTGIATLEEGGPIIDKRAARRRVATWVAREILPHEAAVRARLRRLQLAPEDVDEVIQECYCQFFEKDGVEHIERPAAYFMQAARYIVGRKRMRAKIVAMDAYAEMDLFEADAEPSPEQQVGSRLDFALLRAVLATLPARCRAIVELRKLEGWSQKEIAAHLGITEKVVEKQVWLGVRAIRQAWKERDVESAARLSAFENSATSH
jgi:RNA polymerase sigma factor (sigma-70 family)